MEVASPYDTVPTSVQTIRAGLSLPRSNQNAPSFSTIIFCPNPPHPPRLVVLSFIALDSFDSLSFHTLLILKMAQAQYEATPMDQEHYEGQEGDMEVRGTDGRRRICTEST